MPRFGVMPFPPTTRRAACREELCARLGPCGGEGRYLSEEDLDGRTTDAVVDAVLTVEGLDPATTDSGQRAQIEAVVKDWLFDPNGRGEQSGLPH